MAKARVQSLFIIAFAMSMLLHSLVMAGVLFKRFSARPVAMNKPTKIVEAVAINQQDVEKAITDIRDQEQRDALARRQEMERYQQALRSAKTAREQEQSRLASLNKAKQKLAAQYKVEQRKLKSEARKKAELERQHRHLQLLAAREKARLKKMAKKQQAAELKRKREALALKKAQEKNKREALALKKAQEKQRREELARKKVEAARKKAQMLAKKLRDAQLAKLKAQQRAAQQQALNEELHAEQKKIAASLSRERAKEIVKYKDRIISAIAHSWRVPGNTKKSLSCELLIQVGPGGAVLGVKTLRSSGNSLMDRSARTAVYKASPLPVPSNPSLFDAFRELRLTVRPEQIISS